MRRIPLSTLSGLLFIVSSFYPAAADTPSTMTVQGRLTDAVGNPPPSGFKLFTFKIFDAESGGSEIWPNGSGEDQIIATNSDGLWTAFIGALEPLSELVFCRYSPLVGSDSE